MSNLLYYFSYSMMLLSFYLYFSSESYFINLLLYLEMIGLNIFFFMAISEMSTNFILLMMFLVVTVSEAALGLSVLVKMIRTHSNNYMSSLSLNLC